MTPCRDCDKGHCDCWDHLVERVRSGAFRTVLPRPSEMIDPYVVPEDVVFVPSAGAEEAVSTDESVVGLPLKEALLKMRGRSASRPGWVPSDDDVRVTFGTLDGGP